MRIRRERPEDRDAVAAVHRAAFSSPGSGEDPLEVGLVDGLRVDGDVVDECCLVAQLIGTSGDAADGTIVGHVAVSRGRLVGATPSSAPLLGLGPIGVLPDRQRAGIGSALMHATIAAADALGAAGIILLGDPNYYSRFGFAPAGEHGITPPQDWPGEYFMLLRLGAWTPELRGTFRYAPAFDRL